MQESRLLEYDVWSVNDFREEKMFELSYIIRQKQSKV